MRRLLQMGLAKIFAGSKNVEKHVKTCLRLTPDVDPNGVVRQINATCKLRQKGNICHFHTKLGVIVVDGDAEDMFNLCSGFAFFERFSKTELRTIS